MTDDVLEELGMVTGPDSLNVDVVKEDPNWLYQLSDDNNLNTIQFRRLNDTKKRDKFVS